MKLLAVETATEACSAALLIDGAVVEQYLLAPQRHAELILPMVDELMSDAGLQAGDLDGLVLGRGPGSFTGVRIATGIVQGIAFGADLPVVPISTLAALAQGVMKAFGVTHVLAALDARMGEVYWGAYLSDEQGLARLQAAERVIAPEQIGDAEGDHWTGAGSGWAQYEARLQVALSNQVHRVFPDWYPHAADLALLGARDFAAGLGIAAEAVTPEYLRNDVARKPATR